MMLSKEDKIQERLRNYKDNLGMAEKHNLEGAVIFIQNAINFLKRRKIIDSKEIPDYIKKARQLEGKNKFSEATKIRAMLVESDFLFKLKNNPYVK